MVRADVITLFAPEERGVFETASTTGTQVYCEVKSVKMSEYYKALDEGIEPELVFVLPYFRDYNGEQFAEFNGVKYRIIRSYVNGMKCELTCERYQK